MGICGSKCGSNRSTAGSERSEKCRWDKHGNVFFPVKQQKQQKQQQQQQQQQQRSRAVTTTNDRTNDPSDKSFLNPVYDCESPIHVKNAHHFASFTKFLKGSSTSKQQQQPQPPTSSSSSSLQTTRSRRAAYKDIFVAAKVLRGGSKKEAKDGSTTAAGSIEVRMKQPSLSRSSSTKEGSLTRSSSAKEAALSRCASQKEGKMAAVVAAATTAELLAGVSSLKFRVKAAEEPIATTSKGSPMSDRCTAEKALDPNSLETSTSSQQLEKLECSSGAVMPSFVRNGVGVPSYQPLVFSAGSSPEKCRGRPDSLEDPVSARPRRRRSPGRISPSRRSSPGKRSPTSKKVGVNNGLSLNSSAARFQRSLPNRRAENMCPREVASRTQIPKISSTKVMSSQDRPALRELPKNSVKPDDSLPAKNLPPKPLKDSIPGNGASVLNGDARTGSKRLRSPKKLMAVEERSTTKEYVLNVSVPTAGRSTSGRFTNVSLEVPIQDNQVEFQDGSISDRNCGRHNLDTLQERELLELLERTPKKLKKMALKLALMIELEHSREAEETDEGTLSAEQAQTRAYVMSNSGHRNDNSSLDLELKLGMPNEKSNRKPRDELRLGVSVGVDSPTRAGSVSLPITPRQSVTSICKGFSVEARIGSSKGDISCSDISVHILKNPDKLFGGPNKKSTEAQDLDLEKRADEDVKDASLRGPSDETTIDRCPSFGFERDSCADVPTDAAVAPADENGLVAEQQSKQVDTETKQLDLNKESEASPAFEFKLKPSIKSSPATPMMPSLVEKDALSLSADEIAEIWGAFEAGQGTPNK